MNLAFTAKISEMNPSMIQSSSSFDQGEMEFQVLAEIEGSIFLVEPKLKIAKIDWSGVVSKDTALKLLSMGADSVEHHNYKRLILNRANLIEFETEARIGIKKFLKMRAKRIAHLVKKMAIITPTSVKGSIFSNLITSAISIIIPNLQFQKFKLEQDALNWLILK
ncbi:MAG: hypothetical protein ABJG47_16280 [Ekhidna sp.]